MTWGCGPQGTDLGGDIINVGDTDYQIRKRQRGGRVRAAIWRAARTFFGVSQAF